MRHTRHWWLHTSVAAKEIPNLPEKSLLKTVVKIALPVLVLAGAFAGSRAIKNSAPEAQRRDAAPSMLSVEAMTLTPTDYPVVLLSQGTIKPTTETTLVSEVTGAVTQLSERFVVGSGFEAGEVLVQLDRRDYEIALTGARANVAQARAALEQERAQGSQAAADWQQLGRRGTPSDLTLRKPQMAAAEAALSAARAEVERAQLDLQRTRIVAPYAGRVLATAVSDGQFVNRGTSVGSIYATDSVDVSLPLTSRQLEFLDLPADARGALAPVVELETRVGNTTRTWSGRLVRTEGIDAATQQLNILARVEQPFASPENPLRVGQFVNAKVAGRVLEDVFVVPRAAVRDGREVLVLDGESRVVRRPVVTAWADDDIIAIGEGLMHGDVLVTTPVATIADGTPVRAIIDGIEPAPRPRGNSDTERRKPADDSGTNDRPRSES
jgi:RND family efflux transporter MFP subunit